MIQGENTEISTIYSQSTNPAQRYVESLLINRKNITNLGDLLIPLNVKYMLLTKEVDYKEYFFLFNQNDLILKKETENFSSRTGTQYRASICLIRSISTTSHISYDRASPVKFNAEAGEGYTVFVPPNLDSDHWKLEGVPSLHSESKRMMKTMNSSIAIDFMQPRLSYIETRHRRRLTGVWGRNPSAVKIVLTESVNNTLSCQISASAAIFFKISVIFA